MAAVRMFENKPDRIIIDPPIIRAGDPCWVYRSATDPGAWIPAAFQCWSDMRSGEDAGKGVVVVPLRIDPSDPECVRPIEVPLIHVRFGRDRPRLGD